MNTGIYEIEKTEILRLDPFLKMGKPQKIASYFGGKDGYLKAVKELEKLHNNGKFIEFCEACPRCYAERCRHQR